MAVIDRPEVRIAAKDETRDAFASVQKSLLGLQTQAGALSGGFKNIATVIGGALFTGFIKSGIDSAAMLDDLSEKTSLSVETISQLQRVATIGGHSLESVAGAASKFARSVAEAVGGNEKLIKSFEAVGITQEQLRSQRVDELYVTFAKNIANAENATNALAQATRLAGRGAAEQLPFYKDLAELGLKQATVTAEQAANAEKLQKQIKTLTFEFDQLKTTLGIGVVPVLQRIVQSFGDVLEIINKFGLKAAVFETFNPFKSLAENAQTEINKLIALEARLTAEREKQLARQKQLQDQSPGTEIALSGGRAFEALNEEIAGVTKRLEILRTQQKQVFERGKDEFLSPLDQPATAPRLDIKPPIDEGALKAAQAAAKAQLALDEAKGKAFIDAEKELADRRLSLLSRFYAEGLIEEKEYWDTRLRVQADAINASIAETEKEIARREKAIATAKSSGADRADVIGAEKELFEAQTRRQQLVLSLRNIEAQTFFEARDAAKSYADAVRGAAAELATLQGKDTSAFAVAEFQRRTETLKAKATGQRDQGTLQTIQDTEFLIGKKAEFAAVQRESQLQSETLALEEERINNTRRVGAISELESLRRLSAVRQKNIGQMQELADAQSRIAAESGDKQMILNAERTQVALENLRNETDLVAQKFSTIFETGFTDFFGDVISGAKSVKEAFSDMTKSIVADITRLAAQDVARQIFGGMSGTGKGGASGGGGFDLTGMASKFFASIFGGGAATGMPFVPRDMLLQVHKGERIVPAAQNNPSGGGAGGVTINYYSSGNEDRRSQQQNAMVLGREVNTAMRRSG